MANGGKKAGGKSSAKSNNRKKSSGSKPKSKGRKRSGKFSLNTPAAAVLAGAIIAVCALTLIVTNRLTGAEREKSASEFAWAINSETTEENPFVPVPEQDEKSAAEETPRKTRRARTPDPADYEDENGKDQKKYTGGVILLPSPEVVLVSSEKDDTKESEKTLETAEKEEKTPSLESEAANEKTEPLAQDEPEHVPVPESEKPDVRETVSESRTRITTPPKPPMTTVTERPTFPASSLKKKAKAQMEPKSEEKAKLDIPKATPGAKVCFVFDDGGLHAENVKKYTSLPFPLTVAVLPKLSESEACAKTVLSSGKELILHQPMQAHDYPDGKTPNPGPGAILPGMSMDEAAAVIRENLDSLGASVAGFNNHEGSLITEDAELMGAVLSVAQEKKIYFLDSRTTSQSSVPNVAKSMEMTYIARFAPFLDNEIDRKVMLEMLLKGLDIANRDGYAVIIGHVDKSADILPNLLMDIYPALIEAGYTLTTPSAL